MAKPGTSVLFLCNHNSARSILAEAILRDLGGERFQALSAGSHPSGRVHPQALQTLRSQGHEVASLRSKSWDEFATAGRAPIDIVITVCDDAAGEACPYWPGRPALAHWGLPDPSEVLDDEKARAAFDAIYRKLRDRIERLVRLDLDTIDVAALQLELDAIGCRDDGATQS